MEASVAAQGAPPAGTAPAGGQGQPGGAQPTGGEQGFNWGLFPDVPETSRSLLEPHLRNIQGHVTRMEQAQAPYKGLMEAIQPDQVDPLMAFLDNYQQDPLATAVGIINELQQGGTVPASLSMEALMQVLRGQQQMQVGEQPQPQAQPQQEQIPQWALDMQAQLQQLSQGDEQRGVAEQEAQQDAILQQAKTNIRSQLDQASIPAEIIDDEVVVAAIIASDGDELAAAKMLTDLRDKFLGQFTNGKTSAGAQPPRVQGQLPTAPRQGKRAAGGDRFLDNANVGARQFLEQQMGMNAGG